MSTRKKLKKLLGKTVEYTGIVGSECDTGSRVCIESVQHEGKEVTDHVWVTLVNTLRTHPKGTRVRFKGKAYTYTDKQGKRKHGLNNCKEFTVTNKAYDEVVAFEHENVKRRYR